MVRQTVTVDPDGKRTTALLDVAGNTTGSLDANGNLTSFLYDALNRATVSINPLGKSTTLFDDAGRDTGTLDPNGNLIRRLYDAAGRLTGLTDPLNATTTSYYDKAGQLDALGRANSISGADAGNYSFTQQAGLTANITAAALTVTASNQSKTYPPSRE